MKLPLPFYHEDISDERWAQLREPRCPRCKKPMAFLGRYFKVPPRSAVNQWRKAELLWRNGWQADGYSCGPRTLRDARQAIDAPNRQPTRPGQPKWARVTAQARTREASTS